MYSQNLLNERIREIPGRKKSIYLEGGVFHGGSGTGRSTLVAARHSYRAAENFERLVFDFKGSSLPKVYGYLSEKEKKLYIDFFSSDLKPGISSFGNSKFVKNMDFFKISSDTLSLELGFKSKVSVDIFYLKSPSRLVIDVKN
ncbi:MAG: hypothetical protein HOE90_07920 [Bacteriovoracaceae bacterium]|nr:hypothetical protein [Bacteriovoracaceae bacterium]